MGQCRNLLPVNRLDDFRNYLVRNGFEVRYTKADFSAYQIRINGKGYEVYVRSNTYAGNETIHASIYGPVIKLARDFLKKEPTND